MAGEEKTWGPWLEAQDGRRTIPFRQHGETGRIQEINASFVNDLEAQLAAAREDAERYKAVLERIRRTVDNQDGLNGDDIAVIDEALTPISSAGADAQTGENDGH